MRDVRIEGEGYGVAMAWKGVMCGGLGLSNRVDGVYISGWKDGRKHFCVWENYLYL